MPLTISLERLDEDQIRATANGEPLADFALAALHSALHQEVDDEATLRANGQALWQALGGAALRDVLPSAQAPSLDSTIAIHTDDEALIALPWESLHGDHEDDDFLVLDYLVVRELPNAPLPAWPAEDATWRLLVMGSDPLLRKKHPADDKGPGFVPMRRLDVVAGLERLRHLPTPTTRLRPYPCAFFASSM
ncbi:MAG: hypothetical protein KDD73_16905 [Anaerolineales bacterium]|nr:hypothetical protein [Anaerolineales bacterium]MCB9127610.1 hypothetical protein [Ardenticatenales bacterium]